MFSAWAWGFVFSRFLIWSRRLEGITWMPSPDANSWYCLTDLKFKIHRKRLTYACVLNAITSLLALLFVPRDDLIIILLMVMHVSSTIWWPAFIELKLSWALCFILSCVSFVASFVAIERTTARTPESVAVFFLPILVGIHGWMLCISSHAYFVVKKPTISLEYHRRESRTLEV